MSNLQGPTFAVAGIVAMNGGSISSGQKTKKIQDGDGREGKWTLRCESRCASLRLRPERRARIDFRFG